MSVARIDRKQAAPVTSVADAIACAAAAQLLCCPDLPRPLCAHGTTMTGTGSGTSANANVSQSDRPREL